MNPINNSAAAPVAGGYDANGGPAKSRLFASSNFEFTALLLQGRRELLCSASGLLNGAGPLARRQNDLVGASPIRYSEPPATSIPLKSSNRK